LFAAAPVVVADADAATDDDEWELVFADIAAPTADGAQEVI